MKGGREMWDISSLLSVVAILITANLPVHGETGSSPVGGSWWEVTLELLWVSHVKKERERKLPISIPLLNSFCEGSRGTSLFSL